MKVSYKGKSEDSDYRLAEICYKGDELSKLDNIIEYFEQNTYYHITNVCLCGDGKDAEGYTNCEVDDLDDYKNFMTEWKAAKKRFANKT